MDDQRSVLDECWPELTPLGWGVRVGNVTWTQFGRGCWSDKLPPAERYEQVAALIDKGGTISLGCFMLLPCELLPPFTIFNSVERK